MWILRVSLVVIMISWLGPGANLAWPGTSETAQDALHEVLPGDNLHLIAGYYYGDARQWERIWEANRDRIRNPNLIERGTLLRIPNATSPDESYTDFRARARGVVAAAGAGPGADRTAPPGPGASTEPPAKQP